MNDQETIHSLKSQIEKLEMDAVVMRSALRGLMDAEEYMDSVVVEDSEDFTQEDRQSARDRFAEAWDEAKAALSTDSVKDYASKVQEMREAITRFLNAYARWIPNNQERNHEFNQALKALEKALSHSISSDWVRKSEVEKWANRCSEYVNDEQTFGTHRELNGQLQIANSRAESAESRCKELEMLAVELMDTVFLYIVKDEPKTVSEQVKELVEKTKCFLLPQSLTNSKEKE